MVLGTTRLGFSELTVLDALAQLVSKDKESAKIAKAEIEAKYANYPDIGYLTKQIKTRGLAGIKNVQKKNRRAHFGPKVSATLLPPRNYRKNGARLGRI